MIQTLQNEDAPEFSTRQGEHFGDPLVWLVAAVGTALTAAFFYPGYLNGDSSWQYLQALSGEYHDLHPVILPWVWGFLDILIEGSGGPFLLAAGLFWLGLAQFMWVFSRRTTVFILATFVVGLSPPMFSMLSQIHKDVGMVVGFLLGYMLLVRSERTRTLWPLLLALPAFWYAVAVRHNGASGVLPFTLWMSFLLARDHLGGGLARLLSSPLRKSVVGLLIALAMLGTSSLAARAIMGNKGVHYPLIQFLTAYDVLGVSVRSGHNYLPNGIFYDTQFTRDELKTLYNPQSIFHAYWSPPPTRNFVIETERQSVVDALGRSWVEAVRNEPWSYLRHRAVLFLAHLGIGGQSPIRKLEFTVGKWEGDEIHYTYEYRGPTVFGTPHNVWLLKRYVAGGALTFHPTGLWFRPWPYLALGFLCVLVGLRSRSANLLPIVLLGSSSLLYILPYSLIGTSAELRHMWWPILVSLLQPILLIDGWGRGRNPRGRV